MRKEETVKYEWVQDRFIDINKELDLSNKTINHSEYSIIIDNIVLHESFLKNISQTNKPLKIDTQARCIDLKNYRRGEIGSGGTIDYSIHELYRMSFKDIDTLDTKDLLGNIIILYAIKRAQNGDDEAIREFCLIFDKAAMAVARKFIVSKNIKLEHIETVAMDILKVLIRGDRPENILTLLNYSGLDRLQSLNTRKLDKLVAIYIKIILPYIVKLFYQELSEVVDKHKKCNDEEEKKDIYRGINTLIEGSLYLLLPHSWMMGDPRIVGKRFNSDVFRPSKKTNLTDWLFGKNGRFRQRLSDWFKSQQVQAEIMTDSLDIEIYTGEDRLSLYNAIEDKKNPTKEDIWEKIESEEGVKLLRGIIKKKRISKRDIEILLLSTEKMAYGDIAKTIYERGLSTRILSTKQIGRIIKSNIAILQKGFKNIQSS